MKSPLPTAAPDVTFRLPVRPVAAVVGLPNLAEAGAMQPLMRQRSTSAPTGPEMGLKPSSPPCFCMRAALVTRSHGSQMSADNACCSHLSLVPDSWDLRQRL